MNTRYGSLGVAVMLLCHGAIVAANAKSNPDTSAVAIEPRDPTRPPDTKGFATRSGKDVADNPEQSLVLSSILNSDTRRIAVIDGRLVREGERVAGMTLVQVTANSVYLQHPDRKRQTVLRLPTANIGKDYR